jgi:hypothetical protein
MKKLLVLFSVLLATACSKKNEGLVFDKLLGTWRLSDSSQYEQWVKHMDGTFTSRMFALAGNDTNITEEVTIYEKDKNWHFKVKVRGQNKEEPVTFTSTTLNDSVVQFENPQHDFPRIIHYRALPGNKMLAFIAGTSDTIYFDFTKLPERER